MLTVKKYLDKTGVWQLPVYNDWRTNEAHISPNAKVHFYITDRAKVNGMCHAWWSLCGRHGQFVDDYDSVDINKTDAKYVCKECLKKYKAGYSRAREYAKLF